MNYIKLIISFVLMMIIEFITKDFKTKNPELGEIALCILFGAWIISNGW